LRGDLRPGKPLCAKTGYLGAVHDYTRTAKAFALRPRIPQSGPDTLGNQAALQLRYSTQDRENLSARWRGRVERFR
jgi:hypothetical protein